MTAPPPPQPKASYRELGLLGEGGMAIVQSAVRDDGAAVVIKRVRPPLCFDASYLRLFADEAAVHGALSGSDDDKDRSCAHIVRMLDRGEDEQGPFLVFEHVDGTDLGVLLDRAVVDGAPLDVELVLAVAIPLFSALAFVHEARRNGASLDVVHRDVSPGNVLLGEDGCVKLADFGVAASRLKSEHTVAGELKGKFAYMAPEQTRGEKVDGRADLFAAGIVLWECLQGRRLFDAATDADVVHKVRDLVPAAVDARAGADVAALVATLLEKDPARRPSSARAVKQQLEEIALSRGLDEGLSRVVARAVRQAPRRALTPVAPDVRRRTQRVIGASPPSAPRRRSPVFAAAAVVAVAGIGAVVWLGVDRSDGVIVEDLPAVPLSTVTATAATTPAATPTPTTPTTPTTPATPTMTTTPAMTTLTPTSVAALKPQPKKPRERGTIGVAAQTTATTSATTSTTTSTTPPVAVPAEGYGRLSINSEPWARVSIDGVVVAPETPLVSFIVAAGRHTVLLENPVYGLRKSVVVDVVKDGKHRLSVDLQH